MKIKRRPSNFAQFSDDLWLVVDHDHTSIDVDIPQNELKDFVLMLLDVADDAIIQMEGDNDKAKEKICELMDIIY